MVVTFISNFKFKNISNSRIIQILMISNVLHWIFQIPGRQYRSLPRRGSNASMRSPSALSPSVQVVPTLGASGVPTVGDASVAGGGFQPSIQGASSTTSTTQARPIAPLRRGLRARSPPAFQPAEKPSISTPQISSIPPAPETQPSAQNGGSEVVLVSFYLIERY